MIISPHHISSVSITSPLHSWLIVDIVQNHCLITVQGGISYFQCLELGIMCMLQSYLRELIRLMVPHFYSHLERHADAMELLFCHRWILL